MNCQKNQEKPCRFCDFVKMHNFHAGNCIKRRNRNEAPEKVYFMYLFRLFVFDKQGKTWFNISSGAIQPHGLRFCLKLFSAGI